MKLPRFSILFLLAIIFVSGSCYCQISSLFRFGNVVYYKADNLSLENLIGSSIVFDKKITNRFFDIYMKEDSIGIIIEDSCIYFVSIPKTPTS
jgi:hypothetical protein